MRNSVARWGTPPARRNREGDQGQAQQRCRDTAFRYRQERWNREHQSAVAQIHSTRRGPIPSEGSPLNGMHSAMATRTGMVSNVLSTPLYPLLPVRYVGM